VAELSANSVGCGEPPNRTLRRTWGLVLLAPVAGRGRSADEMVRVESTFGREGLGRVVIITRRRS
jgi:hypothetical protein